MPVRALQAVSLPAAMARQATFGSCRSFLCLEPSELRIREDIRYLNRCAFEGDPPTHCPATGKGSVSLQEFLILERESGTAHQLIVIPSIGTR